jgi:FkbM family methyltransferase
MLDEETGVVTVETARGKLCVYKNDKPISESLQMYGEWAGIEIDFLRQFIPEIGAIVDAGCHVGAHSAAFAEGRPKLIIHAFEPQPLLQELASCNFEAIRERGGAKILLHRYALGDAPGHGYMPGLDLSNPINAGASQLSEMSGKNDILVKVTSLDALCISPVSFIKLDLEGGEGAALEGAHDLISRDRPVIFCEVGDANGAIRIFYAMKGFDYQLYYVETAAFNPRNFRKESSNMFGHARESGLLLLPTGAPVPERRNAALLKRVSDLDTLIRLLHSAPRYGDVCPYARNPSVLMGKLIQVTKEHELLLSRIDKLSSELKERQLAHDRIAVALQTEQGRRVLLSGQLARKFSVRNRWAAYFTWLISRDVFAKACRRIVISGLFDEGWYIRQYSDVAASGMNPVVHYVLYGAYEGRNPNPVFDTTFYLANNADVRASGINPLLHYIKYGETEGRQPSIGFSTTAYFASKPWLGRRRQSWRRSPLRHFLRHGRVSEVVRPAFRPVSPAWSDFERVSPSPPSPDKDVVDIIVPVYRSYADTFACILSVLTASNRTSFELIVIDDCSPERAISADLDRLASRGLITLLRNEKNLGFVATVNRGMSIHPERDVLLLNSDTLVFNDWLDRIRTHAESSDSRVATVTPFTNSGTICSYPIICHDTRAQLEIGFDKLDQLAAASNLGQHVDVPTGVGFCMYISRAALVEVGLFDVENFGAGYGEENDFCMRATQRGWRHVHALDTFVFHSGETSFAESASTGKRRGYEVLVKLHPDYESRVRGYIEADPACHARISLDIARTFGRPVRPLILCISHSLGGGIERHLDERRILLDAEGKDLLVVTPAAPGSLMGRFRAAGGKVPEPSSLTELHLAEALEPLSKALQHLGTLGIEIHSTVGWSAKLLQVIQRLAVRLGVEYTVTLHDYVAVCPQITLINESGRYCGELGQRQCQNCLRKNAGRMHEIHPDWHLPDIKEWRKYYDDFLTKASRVTVPSQDAAQRFRRYFHQLKLDVRPHIDLLEPIHRLNPRPPEQNSLLRVAIIGAIGPHKGSRVLLDCAKSAVACQTPLHFIVVGYTDLPESAWPENVSITGPYMEEDVYQLLTEEQPHLIFLPSVWPETFSYTLSIALATGLPVAVFDLGAQAERLKDNARALRLPLALIDTPDVLNEKLLAFGKFIYEDGQVSSLPAA